MESLIISLLCKQLHPAVSLKVDDSNHTVRLLALYWGGVEEAMRGEQKPREGGREEGIGRYPHD